MKKRSFLRVFALLLCAMLLFTACSDGISGVSKKKSSSSNTYEAPVKITEDLLNTKKFTNFHAILTPMLNGLAEDEVKAVLKALSKSDDIQDNMEDYTDQHQYSIDAIIDEYGDDYKYTYKIQDKEALADEDLRDFKDRINYYLEEPNNLVGNAEDFDSDGWENLAEFLDMSKAETKAYISALEDLCEELGDIKVTEGYELQVSVMLNGSKLPESEESERTMHVYKVNGRWISESVAHTLYSYIKNVVYN